MQRKNYKVPLRGLLYAALILGTIPGVQAQQQQKEKFSQAQKAGYLGQTSRSELARNVLDRLKNQKATRRVSDQTDRVLMWHEILLDSVAIDHTPDPDNDAVGFENGGPTRTSRALAMTQIAVFDAVNAFQSKYTPYNLIGLAPEGASIDSAIAYASFTVQVALYPEQVKRLTNLLESDLAQIVASDESIASGEQVGVDAAEAILKLRADDHSYDPEADWGQGGRVADGTSSARGTLVNNGARDQFDWEPDPLTPSVGGDFKLALGAYWGGVTPFSLATGNQFRSDPPPQPGSREYLRGYWMVQTLGASPDTLGSLSNPITRFIGNYWGYDAVPLLGTPPRMYNQIAVKVAVSERMSDVADMARYLARINTGLADSAIAAWDSKYYYNYWRPVTAIRKTDGVLLTIENPFWEPVGISVINTQDAIRPTPPFPAYPSGHSTFGASTFEIMRQYFGNGTRFTFVSDEYNGEGVDPFGVPRPLVPVRFQTLDSAQASNGISRIFNGVHWQWDDVAGQAMGVKIGEHIVRNEGAFQPIDTKKRQQSGR